MKILPILLLFALAAPGHADAAGFQRAQAPGPAGEPISIGIWYPSASNAPDRPNTPFRQSLALNGAIIGKSLPMVVLSHGDGGWMGGHADTALALAEAGYVAVALTHPGNNYQDDSAPPSRWVLDRPRHIKSVIDHMLSGWAERQRIDSTRIGIFGFSAGGTTALIAAGGIPDIATAIAHCDRHPGELVCRIGMVDDLAAANIADLPASAWQHDPRIAAAVVAAPGFGFAFDEKSLTQVSIPVQLWSGSEDQSVPTETNAAAVGNALPIKPEIRIVEGAGHFAFLTPCNPLLEDAQPKVWQMVCVDKPGFDRAAFHTWFNKDVIAFFDNAFKAE